MKPNIQMGLVLIGLSIFSGCQDGNESISDVSGKEAQAQLTAEREFQRARAAELETDLAERQNFYQKVAGTYEGTLKGASGTFKIRIKLIPSLPNYRPSRIRLPEEVVNDLNNLFFNVQVIQWKEGAGLGAVGCKATQIKPDLETGKIAIASADCPSFYEFQIGDHTASSLEASARNTQSAQLAEGLRRGTVQDVAFLTGSVAPSTSSDILTFSAEKI